MTEERERVGATGGPRSRCVNSPTGRFGPCSAPPASRTGVRCSRTAPGANRGRRAVAPGRVPDRATGRASPRGTRAGRPFRCPSAAGVLGESCRHRAGQNLVAKLVRHGVETVSGIDELGHLTHTHPSPACHDRVALDSACESGAVVVTDVDVVTAESAPRAPATDAAGLARRHDGPQEDGCTGSRDSVAPCIDTDPYLGVHVNAVSEG